MFGKIFEIQPFSVHDGDGIRDTVFLKGCNLHCYWCHNPESISPKLELQFFKEQCISCGACADICPNSKNACTAIFTKDCIVCGKCAEECFAQAIKLVGKKIEAKELFDKIYKHKAIFDKSGGGVTFSGGEPLLQAEFLLECLKLCKENNINTAIETACNVNFSVIEPLLPYIDCIFCDLKIVNSDLHKYATGVPNKLILSNIKKLNSLGAPLRLRTPIIPNFNDNLTSMSEIADFILTLDNPQCLELLTFHNICIGKYTSLGLEYKAKDLPILDENETDQLCQYLISRGINAK